MYHIHRNIYSSIHRENRERSLVRRCFSLLVFALLMAGLGSCSTSTVGSGGGGTSSTPTATATPNSTATSTLLTPTPTPANQGWNEAVVATGHSGAVPFWQVANYDPANGKHATLIQQPPYLAPGTIIDEVSPDGKNLLYQFSNGGHTLYYTLKPIQGTGFFFELNDASAGRALWLPDSRHVLVLATGSAVWNVDTQTGSSTRTLTLPINVAGTQAQIGQMAFYRDNYLYFVAAQGFGEGELCRVPLNVSNPTVQRISFRSLRASYWLSPDGQTIYFANKIGPAGEPGIYAVHNDGTNLHLLRTYQHGTPIGYAADNALEIALVANGKFAIMKLGPTQQQDRVILADAAPGAANLCTTSSLPGTASICDANLALAPYGHAILVLAVYSDTTMKLWYDDLTAGKQQVLLTLNGHDRVQLPGWDRMSV